jgi:hypothetical protein
LSQSSTQHAGYSIDDIVFKLIDIARHEHMMY